MDQKSPDDGIDGFPFPGALDDCSIKEHLEQFLQTCKSSRRFVVTLGVKGIVWHEEKKENTER